MRFFSSIQSPKSISRHFSPQNGRDLFELEYSTGLLHLGHLTSIFTGYNNEAQILYFPVPGLGVSELMFAP